MLELLSAGIYTFMLVSVTSTSFQGHRVSVVKHMSQLFGLVVSYYKPLSSATAADFLCCYKTQVCSSRVCLSLLLAFVG